MEALVYTFLLIGTLMVIFFAVFFKKTLKIYIDVLLALMCLNLIRILNMSKTIFF